MEKKSVSASLLIIYLAALFAVVGSCFYAFVFKNNQITIEEIVVSAVSQISVYNDEEKKEKSNKLKLSDMQVGIKPATGEIDKDTQIPSTINDEGTSEGYFAKVYVDTDINYKILVKNIKIESEKNALDIKEERKNIFITIKDVANTTKSLEKDEFELVTFEDVNKTQELTFLIWLGSLAGEILEGAKITFELSFVAV